MFWYGLLYKELSVVVRKQHLPGTVLIERRWLKNREAWSCWLRKGLNHRPVRRWNAELLCLLFLWRLVTKSQHIHSMDTPTMFIRPRKGWRRTRSHCHLFLRRIVAGNTLRMLLHLRQVHRSIGSQPRPLRRASARSSVGTLPSSLTRTQPMVAFYFFLALVSQLPSLALCVVLKPGRSDWVSGDPGYAVECSDLIPVTAVESSTHDW